MHLKLRQSPRWALSVDSLIQGCGWHTPQSLVGPAVSEVGGLLRVDEGWSARMAAKGEQMEGTI